jgi:hypothetical protein
MPCQSLRTNRSLVLGHLYWGADILGWATKGVNAPPLVTTSSAGNEGIIGQGDTVIRFGNEIQHANMRPGGKLTIGWWFDPNQYSGIEWHYFELDGQNYRFRASGDAGDIDIARPFIDAGTGDESSVLTVSDTRSGSIDAVSNFQLTSTGIVFRKLFWASQYARFDYIAGYRHTHLYDNVRIQENFTVLAGDSDFDAADRVTRVDRFAAVNQFDGADLGFRGWWSKNGKLAITTTSRVALGSTSNTILVNGFTNVRAAGPPVTTTPYTGGVLAQSSNIGRRSIQDFGTVAELGIGLSWQPGCYWKFNLGYTWFYWNQVARALDHIDRALDTDQLAPNNGAGTRPAIHLHTTSFWADGLNGGFTYQF